MPDTAASIPRATFAMLLLVVGLCSAAGVAAGNDAPAAFGMSFYLAAESRPRALPPLQSAPEAEQWRQLIQQREWELGPYGADLPETLLGAGNYFHSRGDFDNAISHWRRAVHLTRVNDGLNSELQFPLLKLLLQSYMDLGDFESADEIQTYLLHLRKQYHQPGDLAYIEANVAYADWQRQQWIRQPEAENPEQLYGIWRQLNDLAREEEGETLSPAQLAPLVYEQLKLLYLISVADFGWDRETEMLFGSQYGGRDNDPSVERSQMQYLQETALSRGRQRLETLAARLADSKDLLAQARLYRAFGDWYLWNDRTTRAADSYRESWQLLDEAGLPDTQRAWYGEPRELPDNGALWAGPVSAEEFADSALVSAHFTVTERGEARDIEAEPASPEEQGKAQRLQRILREGRFRPRLEQGEMMVTEGVTREYRIFQR